MSKTVFIELAQPIDAAVSPQETYQSGLEMAKMLDQLNMEINHKKTFNAKNWQKKYGKYSNTNGGKP